MDHQVSTPDIAAVGKAKSRPRNLPASLKKWATKEDWERHRSLLTHMYLEQGMTLKEITESMAKQFGHHGT